MRTHLDPIAPRVRADNGKLHGYAIRDSSNVTYVGWQNDFMVVRFRSGGLYRYEDVSRQRAVACALAKSVGRYINKKIKKQFQVTKLT